jgi:hypothetical protein
MTPTCSQAVQEFRQLLNREPEVHLAEGPSTLVLGAVRDVVICVATQHSVSVAQADGLVALITESEGSIEVRGGQARLLVAKSASQGSVSFLGDAEDARLSALSAGSVTVGSVRNTPQVEAISLGRVTILR